MRRKLLALAALLSVSVPLMAHAWNLQVRVNTTGGTASIGGGAAFTSTAGTVLKVYTTAAQKATTPVTVTATPNGACSSIYKVIQDGIVVGNGGSYTFTANNSSARTLLVYFATAKTTVRAVVASNGGGSVSPTAPSSFNCGAQPAVDIVYRFTSATGKTITSIAGLPVGAVRTGAADGTSGTATITIPKAAAAALSGTTTITATFSGVTANAGASQTVAPNTLVTLTGTTNGGVFSKWSSAGRPTGAALPFAATGSTNPQTFTPVTAGNYTFKFIVTGGGGRTISQTVVSVTDSFAAAARTQCFDCHNANGVATGVFANWSSSNSKANGVMCYTCHAGAGNGGHPGVTGNDCIGCHTFEAPNHGNNVRDNNTGVRAVVGEFTRWSHHVTGISVNNGHCVACHLEGKVSSGAIVVDKTRHAVDNKVHLRNADTDADFAWNPESPNFSGMDTYCMSCHDANGATSAGSVAVQAWFNADASRRVTGKTASAHNPFGDTISNDYDFEERPEVVNVDSQFTTTNASHHAVKGKKYSGRTRTAADPRQITSAGTFANNSSATLPGIRSTLYDSNKSLSSYNTSHSNTNKFETLYITLANSNTPEGSSNADPRLGGNTLGDDSTLHCADCHTVGQFAARGSVAFGNMSAAFWTATAGQGGITRYYKTSIGAHGSDNEYLLRNNVGTNARHQGAETAILGGNADNGTYGSKEYLVCFNCHAFQTYGTITSNNGATGYNHGGEYNKDNRCNGPFNTIFGNMTGETRLRSMGTATGVTTSTGYGKFIGGGSMYGNIFGIQCANCHNSGVKENIFGGIHGSGATQTYVDGMGNTSKHYRFFPGLGNAMYVPGVKGATGGVSGITGGTPVTYNSYSGNRDGSAANGTGNQTFSLLPVRTVKNTAAGENGNGSYEYLTGGSTQDIVWEQREQQPVLGEKDLRSAAVGCYTLTPPAPNYTYTATAGPATTATVAAFNASKSKAPTGQQVNPKVLYTQDLVTGAVSDDIRNAAATGLTNAEGHALFDAWGGCDDHNGAQGGATGMVRKVLRPTSY